VTLPCCRLRLHHCGLVRIHEDARPTHGSNSPMDTEATPTVLYRFLVMAAQRSAPPPAPAPRHAHDVIPLAPFSTITALANWIVTTAEEIKTKVCTSTDPALLAHARMTMILAPLLSLIPSKLDVAPPNATGLSESTADVWQTRDNRPNRYCIRQGRGGNSTHETGQAWCVCSPHSKLFLRTTWRERKRWSHLGRPYRRTRDP
jgi:hypothetical protein